MDFDLRFVQGLSDVGLALANLRMNEDDQYGTASVIFPSAGQYVVKAVTGSPRNTVVGTSNEVTAVSLTTLAPSSTSTPLPTPTPSLSTSATVPSQTIQSTASTTSAPVEAPSRRKNVPAIVGGVIGALLFLGLLAALIVYVSRRKGSIEKRWSFHKDMMVRRLSRANPPTLIPDMVEAPTLARPEDIEQGLPSPILRPVAAGHVVPSPKGPRPAIKRTQHITIIASPRPTLEPAPQRTRRQQEIADRITMLRTQMVQMRDRADTGHVLDDMQRQMVWLRSQEQSPWALHQTDVVPAGYTRYMTP
ncbi:hypothetical protein M413DRAFT_20944 [Hebeloma cylindrosporum]|uniref:Transmembrane protein n=1 Tax=Hebeloma cylindrosporum TaxID=76867 RepID=A0A0C2YFT3_HEBCY|nr:hypothetical protein M413DRAFT_20944 [Hebeloma cylindrosporum h7]